MTIRCSHLSPEYPREAVQNLDQSLAIKEGVRENLAQQLINWPIKEGVLFFSQIPPIKKAMLRIASAALWSEIALMVNDYE
jgi:hypothetical protein